MFREFVQSYQQGMGACFAELPLEKLERIVELLLQAQENNRTVFILGNGGSASTASHMAVDLGKGTAVPGMPRLRVISLADNIGLITAWGNDASYEVVFKEQLENLLDLRDIVIGITASGNSPNVLRAMEFARNKGATTIGFIGFGGGKLKQIVDIDVTVSSRNYGLVEDFHLSLNHILSQYLKQAVTARLASNSSPTEKDVGIRYLFSKPPGAGKRPAIFLDRDGVINERAFGGYVTEWEQFRFIDGISESIAQLAKLNLPIIVISNQACIGKGLLPIASLGEITERFVATLRAVGGRVDAVYYCPHTPEQHCGCRKPRTGLLERAGQEWGLDLNQSILIGDAVSDLEAARALECRAILFQQENGSMRGNSECDPAARNVLTVRRASEIPQNVNRLLSVSRGV